MSKIPWFKTDDQFHSHPKPRRAGLAAVGLWSLCGSYSMAHKLDGFVPEWFVLTFPKGQALAGNLVAVSLWHKAIRDGEPGWTFHDWAHYQPTADEIEAEREASRERQRAYRARRRNARKEGADHA